MIIRNFYGVSYDFIPKQVPNARFRADAVDAGTFSTTDNTIWLMEGVIPETDVLYEIDNPEAFETKYGNRVVAKFTDFDLDFDYDPDSKERTVKKTYKETIDFNYGRDGTIGWFVVALNEPDSDTNDVMFFSDSIGVWQDVDRIIILETLSGSQGWSNVLKDFTLKMRDVSEIEKATIQPQTYDDFAAGAITINPVTGDDIISNAERKNEITLTGAVMDIEEGQPVNLTFNDVNYSTTVENQQWSLTIPQDDVLDLNFDTDYSIHIECSDRAGNVASTDHSVYVKHKNVGPEISVPTNITLDRDTSKTFTATISDSDGSIKSVDVLATNGTVNYNETDETIEYIPNDEYYGTDTIEIEATDDLGAKTSKSVAVDVLFVNYKPIIDTVESISTNRNTSVSFDVSFSDTDTTYENLQVNVSALNSTASVSFDSELGKITYSPEYGFVEPDTIEITVTDEHDDTTVKNVSVEIINTNSEPVIDTVSSIETMKNTTKEFNIEITDADTDDTASVNATAVSGTVVFNDTDSTISYTPNTDYTGTDTITISVDDGTAVVEKDIDVMVYDQVSISTDSEPVVLEKNTTKTVVVSFSPTYANISVSATNGSVAYNQNDNTITYTPNTDYFGTDTIDISGSADGFSSTKSVAVEVKDSLVLIVDEETMTMDMNTSKSANFTIENNSTVNADANNGVVELDTQNEVLTYTPSTDYFGTDTISITAGNQFETETVTIDVTINEVLRLSLETDSITLDENTSKLIGYTAGAHTEINASATNGTATLDTNNNKIEYIPETDYTGSDTIEVSVTDGVETITKTISVTINSTNSAPEIVLDSTTLNIITNETKTITYSVTDADDDLTTATVESNYGTATVDHDTRTISYTAGNEVGNDSITISVSDSTETTTKTISVTITSGS